MTTDAAPPSSPPAPAALPDRPAKDPLDPATVLSTAWRLDPGVAVRPEPFGALLYHFGTRRLSFVRSREVVGVVQALAGSPTARAACEATGVPPERMALTARALATLAASGLIQERG
jgi:putative mycofactocin binding protein MftB